MIAAIDLKAEFAKLTMLEGRTPTTSEAERKGAFARQAPIATARFSLPNSLVQAPGSGIRRATRLSRSSMARRRCT
jgi:hypothetical protein